MKKKKQIRQLMNKNAIFIVKCLRGVQFIKEELQKKKEK